MAVKPAGLTLEEKYLVAIIQDDSGIDLAELLWDDPTAPETDHLFRAWDFQVSWWRDRSRLIIDSCARAVGKSMSIILRGWAFAIQHPGAEMVITAPEAIHLDPLTSRVEERLRTIRITRELLYANGNRGIKHRPFHIDFSNKTKLLGRIPQRDGKGVKGLHPYRLEMDEAQDYPPPGWIELIETLKHGDPGSQWRAHGVSRGVRDEFYRHSQPGSGWSVHVITGMHRTTWSDEERRDKIEAYGSRDSPDYKRNILGAHGDATNPLFVLTRLMACVDSDEGSDYNIDTYYYRRLSDEMTADSDISNFIDPPGNHKQWGVTWGGMDVGLTQHPTEILVFGEEPRKGEDSLLRLIARYHLERISSPDQRRVIDILFQIYNFRRFTLDRTGLGLPVFQEIQRASPNLMNRVVGYNADNMVTVGYDEHDEYDDPDEFAIKRRAKEYGYDLLRTYVDTKRFALPWDRELLGEWQGQTWVTKVSALSPYGRKIYKEGQFHTLDAAAMMVLGRELKVVEAVQEAKEDAGPVPLIMV